jgi:hypothetical protein
MATLGVGFGARVMAYLGLWPVTTAPPAPIDPGPGEGGGGVRLRTRRLTRGYVEREIQTPDGPLIVVVPDDWTADDLMTLTQALLLAGRLN